MYKVGLQRKETIHVDAKLAIYAKESPIRTREEAFCSCVFTTHSSGPCHIGRLPEDPIIQDSLSSPELAFNDDVISGFISSALQGGFSIVLRIVRLLH